MKAMEEIAKASKEISAIIGAIDEITFQTNLLALNAGVEAARAGEAGKGFAVVAQEVRELATRSADAAREIKELVARSVASVDQGVTLFGRTGEALNGILGRVEEVRGEMASIVDATREQASAIAHISVDRRDRCGDPEQCRHGGRGGCRDERARHRGRAPCRRGGRLPLVHRPWNPAYAARCVIRDPASRSDRPDFTKRLRRRSFCRVSAIRPSNAGRSSPGRRSEASAQRPQGR